MAERAIDDGANGYQAHAGAFISGRARSDVGVAPVRVWGRTLPPGAAVLDLGCGCGVPISQALIEDGFSVYGVDASAAMVAAFRKRFPHVPVACEPVERSRFFNRTFDGAVAWGLMFLLPAEVQLEVVRTVAAALNAGGRFLFTAPEPICSWADNLTDRPSVSLGFAAYEAALRAAGLTLIGTHHDAGDNHYYSAVKRSG